MNEISSLPCPTLRDMEVAPRMEEGDEKREAFKEAREQPDV